MRIKEGYVLREVAGQIIVVPTGDEIINFNGVITLNQSGKLLWEKLSNDASLEELVEALLEKYDVDVKQAEEDVRQFIEVLEKHNILKK